MCDALRVWNISVKEVLLKAGAEKSKSDDSSIEIVKYKDWFAVMLMTSFGEAQTILKRLSFKNWKKYLLLVQRNLKVLIILDYSSKNDCIYLEQKLCIEELKKIAIDTKRKMSKEAQLTTGEARQLKGLTGQLNWTSSQTRPDMSFGACEISTSDLIHPNENIRRLKAEQIASQFPNIESIKQCITVCYSDVSFANLKNELSQDGYKFLYKDKKKFVPISWKSKKIQRAVKSTLAAETLALIEALETCFMIRAIMLEIYKKSLIAKHFQSTVSQIVNHW